jgi:hypothetical protein
MTTLGMWIGHRLILWYGMRNILVKRLIFRCRYRLTVHN